ncbi:uncharacterized protein LOC106138537 [Amyelois transitella]|uniref:uncharacterized protein LOC106138537 n=1 Tax=Amyelois transitella TaxID=680683 RepID=UPI00298FF098|nr:uncharacterized protein LOC106138537 [Amyelois transitella]
MYRWIVPILLCTVHSAPQDTDITYVRIQPLNTDPKAPSVEHQPLNTDPPKRPNVDHHPLYTDIPKASSVDQKPLHTDPPKEPRIDHQPFNTDPHKADNINPTPKGNESESINQSDKNLNAFHEPITSKIDLNVEPSENIDPSIINKFNRIATDDPLQPKNHRFNVTEISVIENANRFARSEITTNYETTTDAVTDTERELRQTIQFEARTRPPLRYLSKLSYYKSTVGYGGSDVNLLERGGKRRFRSKCRCEKIWNCPKLQITVPRCPDEYFLCCF